MIAYFAIRPKSLSSNKNWLP